MKRINLVASFLVGAAMGLNAFAQTTLYKSVGANGRTVYSDRPPEDGRATKTMTFEDLPSSPPSPATLAFLEQLRQSEKTPPAAVAASGEVVLFSAAWCGYCKKAKTYLSSKGIAFREVNVETKSGALMYAQAGGRSGIPLLLAGSQRVAGFSSAAYDALFAVGK